MRHDPAKGCHLACGGALPAHLSWPGRPRRPQLTSISDGHAEHGPQHDLGCTCLCDFEAGTLGPTGAHPQVMEELCSALRTAPTAAPPWWQGHIGSLRSDCHVPAGCCLPEAGEGLGSLPAVHGLQALSCSGSSSCDWALEVAGL